MERKKEGNQHKREIRLGARPSGIIAIRIDAITGLNYYTNLLSFTPPEHIALEERC